MRAASHTAELMWTSVKSKQRHNNFFLFCSLSLSLSLRATLKSQRLFY